MAIVSTGGRLADIHHAPIQSPPTVLRLGDDTFAAYADIWRTQPQVRTVVSFLARNIAQLGLHVYRRVSDTDRERLTEHPLATLLSKPTPDITGYRLIERLVSDLALHDIAYWVKIRSAGTVVSLVPVPPPRVALLGDDWIAATGYRITGNRGHTDLPARDVVAFRGYNPDDLRTGVSPMETLRALLAEEHDANQFRRQMWRNGARASGYLTRPVDAPEWSNTARDRFRRGWQAQYTGDGPAAGGTPVLEDGMQFQQASFDPRSAQYIEARKLTREEVAAAFHIPLPMVGILDHATFSNIREQHKQLYQDTLGPWLVMLCAEIGLQLVDDLDDTGTVYTEFNIEAKLSGSFEEQATAAQAAVGSPWMTVNEQRGRFNLPSIKDGDELIRPLNVSGADDDDSEESVDDEDQEEDEKPPAKALVKRAPVLVKARAETGDVEKLRRIMERFFARQGEAVAKSGGFDAERWDAELAADLFAFAATVTPSVAGAALKQLDLDPADYDVDRTLAWLEAHTSGVATGINAATASDLETTADEDVGDLFTGYAAGRAAQIALTESTALAGWASIEAVRQSGRDGTKTWQITSRNSRRSHARLNGQTVPIGSKFGNGARWPGDSRLPSKERAGCKCFLQIGVVT